MDLKVDVVTKKLIGCFYDSLGGIIDGYGKDVINKKVNIYFEDYEQSFSNSKVSFIC